MHIQLLQSVPYAEDGIHVRMLKVHETHDLAPAFARGLIECGAAVAVVVADETEAEGEEETPRRRGRPPKQKD